MLQEGKNRKETIASTIKGFYKANGVDVNNLKIIVENKAHHKKTGQDTRHIIGHINKTMMWPPAGVELSINSEENIRLKHEYA